MDKACKSNDLIEFFGFGQKIWFDSGKRVSNEWVIYLRDRDNIPKGVLIPDKTTVPHGTEVKDGDPSPFYYSVVLRKCFLNILNT